MRPYYEALINSFPVAWLKDPTTGEEVANLAEGERRLRAFAALKGFDVVRTGGGNSRALGTTFKCVHHGKVTVNKRGLKDRVTRNEEGKITSRRRRDTRVRQTECTWAVRVSFKARAKDKEEKAWTLSVISLTHKGHECTEDPLTAYPRHLKEIG